MKKKDSTSGLGVIDVNRYKKEKKTLAESEQHQRKKTQLDIEEKNRELAVLNEVSLELALLPSAHDVARYIAKKLMSITHAAYVHINRYDKDTHCLQYAHAHAKSRLFNQINRILDNRLRRLRLPVGEETLKEFTSEIVHVANLYDISLGGIPRAACSLIESLVRADYCIAMVLVIEGECVGSVMMIIPRGAPPVSLEMLKSLSPIFSVALRRNQAEQQRIASEEKFRKLFYISPDAIILSQTQDGRIVSVNKGFTKMLGREEDEVVGKTMLELGIHKDLKDHDKIVHALRTNKAVENRECCFVNRSGRDVMGLVSAAAVEIGDKKYVLSAIRDITEFKRAERELRESKALLDAIVENVPLMIFLKEARDLKFVIFNRAGEELLGHKRSRMLGRGDADLFPAEQAAFFMAKDREVLDGKTGMMDIPQEPLLTARKGRRLLHTRKVCIRGADGVTKFLLGISEDITERTEAEAKLLAYQEQLRALTSELALVEERERRRIAAELHDRIGQNLTLCKLKVVAMEIAEDREAARAELAAVHELLEVSIQDARSLIFELSPPVLYELGFQAALEWLAEWIGKQYHIPVEFESRAGSVSLKTDRQVILFQVVRELLFNVGKHSRASRAKVILSRQDAALKIQVNDDGVGFDPSQIYDSRERKGSFGFFSMRERLNYLRGGIEVKSKPGRGSQIVLTVPQDAPPAAGAREDT